MKLSRAENQIWWRIIVIAAAGLLAYGMLATGRSWVPWWFIRTAPIVLTVYILACYFGGIRWKPLQFILMIVAIVATCIYSYYLLNIDVRWFIFPIWLLNGANIIINLIRSDNKPEIAPVKSSQQSMSQDQGSDD
ncbi:MAG: hypothetical protein ACYC27_12565 [Armatimonadota bacterium]